MPEHRRTAREHAGEVVDEQRRDERRHEPLRTSTTIVGTPSFHPIARQTFVAPIEREPDRRMSIPRTSRTSQ